MKPGAPAAGAEPALSFLSSRKGEQEPVIMLDRESGSADRLGRGALGYVEVREQLAARPGEDPGPA
jgi:hypothetical protein